MSNSKTKDSKAEEKKPVVYKKYKYTGNSVKRFTAEKKDICLVRNLEVSLPCDNEHVKRLVAKGQLKEIKTKKTDS